MAQTMVSSVSRCGGIAKPSSRRARVVATTEGKMSGAAGRREFLSLAGATGAAALGLSSASPAYAEASSEEADALVDVYFGCGCFWHVQHEFIEAERRILGRKDEELTSLTGYAGGTQIAKVQGVETVCYHTFPPGTEAARADYGRLGHGEVAGMKIPAGTVGDFATEYFSLLDKNGDRPDKLDRGGEYRNLIGLPGGMDSPLMEAIESAKPKDLILVSGKGNDGDTLGSKKIWVYDTAAYPFHQAEVYHQYHDGFFPGENYPDTYNDLARKAVVARRLSGTGCPDIV